MRPMEACRSTLSDIGNELAIAYKRWERIRGSGAYSCGGDP